MSGGYAEARRDFWAAVDREPEPGVLVALVFTSWKEIADHQGIPAVDVGWSVFEAVGSAALASAPMKARLSTTTFAAYWPDAATAQQEVSGLDRAFPVEVRTPTLTMSVTMAPVVIERSAGQAGESLYLQLQTGLSDVVDQLPPALRYPALSPSWAEVRGTDTPD